jgi:hypothetical protein
VFAINDCNVHAAVCERAKEARFAAETRPIDAAGGRGAPFAFNIHASLLKIKSIQAATAARPEKLAVLCFNKSRRRI